MTASTDGIDPYAALAEEQISAPVKARMRATKTREERRVAKQLSDKQILNAQWRQGHAKRVKALLSGCHGDAVQQVASFLESMTLDDGGELVALIEQGAWHKADEDTRYLLLGLIDQRIVHLRIIEGLPPFDDSLFFSDDAPTAFEIIREILRGE